MLSFVFIYNISALHLFEYLNRRIANTETYNLAGLYPDTIYYVWLAARSQRGEGATTPPIPVLTKQHGKNNIRNSVYNSNWRG